MFTVTFATTEQAQFVAEIVAPFGVPQPRIESPATLIVADATLEILADLDEETDGHCDYTHVWIDGTGYPITRMGRPAVADTVTRTVFTTSKTTLRRLDHQAAVRGISRSELIRQYLDAGI